MATVNRVVRSGNHIMAMFDDKQIGLIQSVGPSDDYGLDAASGLGDIHVQEYVPGMARHSIQVEGLVLKKDDMLAAGIVPENGDVVLKGLVFDIVVADKETGEIIRAYRGCSYNSGSYQFTKHQIVAQSAQFMALDVSGTGT